MFAYLRYQHELDTKLLNKICLSKNKGDWVELVLGDISMPDDGLQKEPNFNMK